MIYAESRRQRYRSLPVVEHGKEFSRCLAHVVRLVCCAWTRQGCVEVNSVPASPSRAWKLLGSPLLLSPVESFVGPTILPSTVKGQPVPTADFPYLITSSHDPVAYTMEGANDCLLAFDCFR